METIASFVFCTLLVLAGTVQEPRTGVDFPDTLQLEKGTVSCTGVDVRTKLMVKVYAIAHYGDADAFSKSEAPERRLQSWIDAQAQTAFILKITYGIDAKKMREACDEGFDRVGYHGKAREAFLGAFKGELKKGDELRMTAQSDGTLTMQQNGATLGSWKEPELVKALWSIWMGEKSPLSDRTRLVAR